jgi:tellurite resistance protein
MKKVTPHEALIYAMVTMSAVDRKMTDTEFERMANVVKTLPAFLGFDPARLVEVAERCAELLGEDDGLDDVLHLIAESLPRKLHETVYACALEVAAADLRATDEEIRLLEMMRDALRLDKLVTAALERGARARHQTL